MGTRLTRPLCGKHIYAKNNANLVHIGSVIVESRVSIVRFLSRDALRVNAVLYGSAISVVNTHYCLSCVFLSVCLSCLMSVNTTFLSDFDATWMFLGITLCLKKDVPSLTGFSFNIHPPIFITFYIYVVSRHTKIGYMFNFLNYLAFTYFILL